MDFYQIGAMKVFSELGQLIEEDQKNQLKITSLNSDIMQKIGSYLLEDKNKTIQKCGAILNVYYMPKHLKTAKHARDIIGREHIEIVDHYKYQPNN